MKKFVLISAFICLLTTNATAGLYHGIDIDAVYNSSDWDSKESIKEIIDDYTLLLQYQAELDSCPIELPDVLGCYDKVAEKIITTLYVYPEYNVEEYKLLKEALSNAYGLKNCRNKYAWPSGHMCEIDSDSELSDALKKYLQDLIDKCKHEMKFYYPRIIKNYK